MGHTFYCFCFTVFLFGFICTITISIRLQYCLLLSLLEERVLIWYRKIDTTGISMHDQCFHLLCAIHFPALHLIFLRNFKLKIENTWFSKKSMWRHQKKRAPNERTNRTPKKSKKFPGIQDHPSCPQHSHNNPQYILNIKTKLRLCSYWYPCSLSIQGRTPQIIYFL
jgi:hypothetical protein